MVRINPQCVTSSVTTNIIINNVIVFVTRESEMQLLHSTNNIDYEQSLIIWPGQSQNYALLTQVIYELSMLG